MISLLASLTLEDERRPDLGLPQVVCKYEDVFPAELPGLPSRSSYTLVRHPFL